MQQKNNPDAAHMIGDMQSNMTQMMEAGQKTIQAVAEANQRMMQGWQSLFRRQAEMTAEFLQDNVSAAAPMDFASTSTEQRLQRQADLFKSVCQRSIANTQELASMASACTKDAADVISARVMDSMDELRTGSDKA